MSELQELSDKIDRLESKNQIENLITAYAIACDEHDIPRLGAMWTPDATFDSPNKTMVANGQQAIIDMFNKILGIRGPGYHWTHDRVINIDPKDPDKATGLVLGHAETTPNGKPCLAAMKYEDVYRRIGGKWLFQSRVLSFFYYTEVGDYAEMMSSALRFRVMGNQFAADYPESTASWKEFAKKHPPKAAE